MVGIVLLCMVLVGLILIWYQARVEHERRLEKIRIRIFVNGIRGKSTVTRLIAGLLRESGLVTLGKTTGSAAMVLLPDGSEIPIERRSAPTINELVEIIDQFTDDDTDAIVLEAMALHPNNQRASQDIMVKANITVITNIREDHQDVMGETLEEIADVLSLTIPYHGILITCEDRPELRERLQRNAEARGSRMIYADPTWVTEADMSGFTYLTFRENLAAGLAVAQLLGIPRDTAMRGMRHAQPDVGVVNLQRANWYGKEIIWAPLFAVNDRESLVLNLEMLKPYYRPDATRIGILNNRTDRGRRTLEFADIAAKDIQMDYLVTFGEYESIVTARLVELGYPAERIINLGFSVNPTLQQIIDRITGLIHGSQALLVGMVNIHTPQAELMLDYFHSLPDAPDYLNEEITRTRYRSRSERLKARASARLVEVNEELL